MVKNGVEKSFVVIDGDLRLLLEYEAGWYTVSSLDIRGLNTQGKTIEKAIENAHDAAKLLAEDREAMMREVRDASKKARKTSMAKSARVTRKAPTQRNAVVKA
jgi:predicted RNase H-like HicB family nuclease